MAKSTSKTPVVNNTLESEGKALASIWRGIAKGNLENSTKSDGFDTRRGKLMLKLKAEGGERISSQRLKDCGIAGIDKRRRSEAMWFVENEDTCRSFIKTSKKGFTSLTALQAAMRKADKAEQPKADKADKPASEADTKSNDGLNSEADEADLTASEVAMHSLVLCDMNGIAIKDFMLALKEQLEMLDTEKAVA